MAWNNTMMQLMADAARAAATHAQLHSAAAGGSGTSNVTTAGREAITWGTATNDGDFGLAAALEFTGGASQGAVYSVTMWSAATNGTFYGEFVLTGDSAFNDDGEFTVSAINNDGSAT